MTNIRGDLRVCCVRERKREGGEKRERKKKRVCQSEGNSEGGRERERENERAR